MLLKMLRIPFCLAALGSGAFQVFASELCVLVNDSSDLALPRAWVHATMLPSVRDHQNGMTYNALTDSRGRACLSVPEGSYSVEVGLTGFLNVRYFPVRVLYPNKKELSFRLPFGDINADSVAPEAVLTGVLELDGKPSQWARICLLDGESGQTVTCGASNEFGEYALSVPPGSYKVEIRAVHGGVYRSVIKLPRPGAYRNELAVPNAK